MTAPDTSLAPLAPETIRRLRELNDRFTDVGAAERANYQIYLMKLCDAIGVAEPRPAAVGGRVAEHIAYLFEFPLRTTTQDVAGSTNFIDARREIVARHLETLVILGELRVDTDGTYRAAAAA